MFSLSSKSLMVTPMSRHIPTILSKNVPSLESITLLQHYSNIQGKNRWLSDMSLSSFTSMNTLPVESESVSTLNFMLILGKPGGGKGTISGKILKDFPMFHHLSTGDMLRSHVRNQSELGRQAKKYMDAGALVPDELIISLVMEEAALIMKRGHSLLLDGFPRSMDQAISLDKKLQVNMVVNLDIPTETIVERIADRWIHPASGRVYNYSYNPPLVHGRDNETGEELIQRDDDKPETVRRRLEAYDKVTAPLVKYYSEKGVLRTFHGTMSDMIYPNVKRWLDERLTQTDVKKEL